MTISNGMLNELYNKVSAIPLDLKIIQPDNWNAFWQVWETEKDYCTKIVPKGAPPAPQRWQGLDLLQDVQDRRFLQPYSQDMRDACHDMIREIEEVFPFSEISQIRLWSNVQVVLPHKDGVQDPKNERRTFDRNTGLVFPRAFRIMLYDDNPRPTFYMQPDNNLEGKERQYVRLPPTTNSFVFNDTTSYHGADLIEGHSKILLLLAGTIDRERYHDLLQRSLKLYGDHVVSIPFDMDDINFTL